MTREAPNEGAADGADEVNSYLRAEESTLELTPTEPEPDMSSFTEEES